jgi:uncharacterized protein YceK
MGVFLDQKLGFCYTYSMKNLIVIAAVLLAGCSALKTQNAPNTAFNGTAYTADINQQISKQQKDLTQLNKLLAQFPRQAMDIEMLPLQVVSQHGNQTTANIVVKANFKQEWLIGLWQNLYALGDPDGAMSQIDVSTVYDVNGPDHWDTARYVRGMVKFRDRAVFDTVARNMFNSNPTVQLTFVNAKNQAVHTMIVDMPALTHSYTDQTTPVFVDVGWKPVMRPINFNWPIAPLQLRINSSQPIWMPGQITVDTGILTQTTRIFAQIVRQN